MALLPHHVLVVGAGAAGTAAATELRRLGFRGQVTILNGEEVAPYNRTTVNTTLLQPGADLGSVGQGLPADEGTTLVSGARARSVDLDARRLLLEDGARVDYDTLLVASGARPRPLPASVDAAAWPRVTTLRTAADAARIRSVLDDVARSGRPGRVVVAGAGLLGSETADVLSGLGHRVHLVDPAALPLGRLLGHRVASWVADRHRDRLAGVHHDTVRAVEPGGRDGTVTVHLTGGSSIEADLVVAALGVVPDVDWLAGTGLDDPAGVVTDVRLRVVGVPGVYAAGDVARVGAGSKGEHWSHALAQGSHAARVIAHDQGLAPDPGPLEPASSFTTRLHGVAVGVLGAIGDGAALRTLVDRPAEGVHVSAATSDGRVHGVVATGPLKLVNRLRPVVASHSPLEDAVAVLRQLGHHQPTGAPS